MPHEEGNLLISSVILLFAFYFVGDACTHFNSFRPVVGNFYIIPCIRCSPVGIFDMVQGSGTPFCNLYHSSWVDRLCGLVVRVPGYRSRGPGFDSWRYQIF
jgi:hypothetical protein